MEQFIYFKILKFFEVKSLVWMRKLN